MAPVWQSAGAFFVKRRNPPSFPGGACVVCDGPIRPRSVAQGPPFSGTDVRVAHWSDERVVASPLHPALAGKTGEPLGSYPLTQPCTGGSPFTCCPRGTVRRTKDSRDIRPFCASDSWPWGWRRSRRQVSLRLTLQRLTTPILAIIPAIPRLAQSYRPITRRRHTSGLVAS